MIYTIKGPSKSGKSFLANALRNTALSEGKGALIVDSKQAKADVNALIEKLLVGVTIEGDIPPLNKLPWKADPVVIIVGEENPFLDNAEKLLPGFTKKFGPVSIITTELA